VRRFAMLAPLLLSLLLPAVAAAQEATSQPDLDVPSPEECTVAPRTLAELQELFARPATPAAASANPTAATPPSGTPVDAATADAVERAIREFIACFNAGDFWRQMATYSDRYVQVYLQSYLDPATGINQDIYDLYATPRPMETEHRTALLGIDQIVQLPDGRVRAVVTADDPADDVAPGKTLVYLVKTGNRWQIDDFVYIQSGG
jgi:ketosteroid isomerase-like protein